MMKLIIVKLHNFLQPLALPRHLFSPDEPFLPHPPRQNNFQNSSPLETSETVLVCIVCTPLSAEVVVVGGREGRGRETPTKFSKSQKKMGIDKTSTLRSGVLEKRGLTFFRGVAIFTKEIN